jgi:predicted nucleic acid binding AN1-type Zn finger protein
MHKCEDYTCKYKVMKFIGQCKGCEKVFCHLHRYPESHFCIKLKEKQQIELKRLSDKLFDEATKKPKVVI